MPVDPNAEIEISALKWVPASAHGLVRDLRVRWALEEAGLSYRERLLDFMGERSADDLDEQPFGQVPIYKEGPVRMFESGAIVLHIAERSETLMPRGAAGRARTMSWVLAAINSVEPVIWSLIEVDRLYADAEWARLRRPDAKEAVQRRLGQLSDRLGTGDFLEDRFTAGDLMMTTVLRVLRYSDLVAQHANLAAYQARCEARPAFQRALEAQLAVFEKHEPAQAA
jgi:glutathione S-transferase